MYVTITALPLGQLDAVGPHTGTVRQATDNGHGHSAALPLSAPSDLDPATGAVPSLSAVVQLAPEMVAAITAGVGLPPATDPGGAVVAVVFHPVSRQAVVFGPMPANEADAWWTARRHRPPLNGCLLVRVAVRPAA